MKVIKEVETKLRHSMCTDFISFANFILLERGIEIPVKIEEWEKWFTKMSTDGEVTEQT